jgi:proteasome lid subunit RPN8/RPN11
MIEPVAKPIPTAGYSAGSRLVGAVYPGAPTIYVFEDVLARMLRYAETDLARELGGFLVGGLHEDHGIYVEVRGFVPATETRSGAISVTFTHETWAAMTRRVEEDFPGEVILGWMHTHPGLGVFLSSYDLFIHRHFFAQPWQIAAVIDPQKRQLGLFQWRHDQIANCGFVCLRRNVQ